LFFSNIFNFIFLQKSLFNCILISLKE
jgi:hypothetical protein